MNAPRTGSAPAIFVQGFRDSMPEGYRQQQSEEEIREHADIAWRRGEAKAHAEIWRTRPGQAVVACLVTDDRPGLLSLVSATIAAHGLDVHAAKAYTRKNDAGRSEAVDFFWLRRIGELGARTDGFDEDVARVATSLRSLLAGEMDLSQIIKRASAAPPSSERAHGPAVTFAPDEGGFAVLVVEAADRPGLLWAITGALYEQGIVILRSEVTTVDGVARDRFYVADPQGLPLSDERRTAIAEAVARSVRRTRAV